ncbi:TlpA family protein disulfide reductase [Pedobacter nutrimenti]|uniref:TlpA family protein disulfide reductase n=1 Tax=Pedobacter nutrimenti TaxID=1241337 RepID=UPI00292F7B70|nr:TlpA family protein disulfide reductase [Pedobacter nutrimenti]
MKILLGIALCLCWLSLCRNTHKSEVIIEGSGFDKTIKKVYLTQSPKWYVILDSANCIDGRFKLNYKPSTPFEPFSATICYYDGNNKSKSFFIRNEILMKRDHKEHGAGSTFMVDHGTTSFTYYPVSSGRPRGPLVNIKGGREQDLLEEYDEGDFGWIPKVGDKSREIKFKHVVEAIKRNSFSFYFLNKITSSRWQYSKNELKEIFAYFDKDVQKSRSANRLKEHILNSPEEGENSKSLSLTSDKGVKKENINRTAKLNMLIFWASWCGPCRLEIPQLRKMHERIKNKNFYMASISIDRKKKDWDIALGQEKLNWDQFLVNESEIDEVKAQYTFTSIPLVIFTNGDGKELARYIGYNEDHVNGYKKIISDNLHIKLD